jgi:DNA-binding response OmpR family regulator
MTMSRSFPNILVADDEPGFRALLRFALEPYGFNICLAANGREAIDLFRRRRFDLAILDVHMPLVRGGDVAKQMLRFRPDQAIIMLTGAPDLAEKEELISRGVASYLVKPVDIYELAEIASRLVKREMAVCA